jgi:hypothetical protein
MSNGATPHARRLTEGAGIRRPDDPTHLGSGR